MNYLLLFPFVLLLQSSFAKEEEEVSVTHKTYVPIWQAARQTKQKNVFFPETGFRFCNVFWPDTMNVCFEVYVVVAVVV